MNYSEGHKTAPLIIHINFSYCPKSDPGPICSLGKALGHMGHIQDLWIDCHHSEDVLNMICARLSAVTPLLWSLHLSTFEGSENHFIICKDTLPGASLRKLHLESCHVDWSSPIFNGLTELSLSCILNVEIPTRSLPFFWYLLIVSLLVRRASLCKHRVFSSARGFLSPQCSKWDTEVRHLVTTFFYLVLTYLLVCLWARLVIIQIVFQMRHWVCLWASSLHKPYNKTK